MPCTDTVEAFWADRELELLRGRFPRWHIWYVPCYPNLMAWCARREDEQVARFNRNSPDELASAIEVAEAEERREP